ncbi:hypothetical protein BBD42_24295 [Paenibacillus sp. BIHB 4019]|uniref:DUF2809 domain-containing protein n=1 Tax=Paenibacillus sp. BIHB 4019 TaxID=1870819 RepID=A0A1B2DTC8_9BACL|nr:DUF2809 domain-containing protein [Paenibacillus sp. BIHB 4019]ANY70963.1 hypothetical protein BBD42_24295 [Paenibacillus sp. BIHB 4019]
MLKPTIYYAAAFLLAMALGFSSRYFASQLPSFVVAHFGDILWASMVYFGFRMLQVRRPLLLSLACSAAFSYGIEFSQLYQADWIRNVRHTTLGGLVLGQGFSGIDLVRYSIGILPSYAIDYFVCKRVKAKPKIGSAPEKRLHSS